MTGHRERSCFAPLAGSQAAAAAQSSREDLAQPEVLGEKQKGALQREEWESNKGSEASFFFWEAA